jgi:hypothetical protein
VRFKIRTVLTSDFIWTRKRLKRIWWRIQDFYEGEQFVPFWLGMVVASGWLGSRLYHVWVDLLNPMVWRLSMNFDLAQGPLQSAVPKPEETRKVP